MKNYFTGQNVLLRDLKMGTVIKKLPKKEAYLVSYYNDENILKYRIIENETDIIDETEYAVIRNRINTINKLL